MMLRFFEKGFAQPFYSQRMSDGTLKLFAYYLLLYERNPRQFVFIEEPENGLYHQYLGVLAQEMKDNVGNGFSDIKRASEFTFVKELAEEGVSLGDMWYGKYFEDAEA